MASRLKPCNWCGEDVPDDHIAMRAESLTGFYTEGRYCDPSCLLSWLDEHCVPSAKPKKVGA